MIVAEDEWLADVVDEVVGDIEAWRIMTWPRTRGMTMKQLYEAYKDHHRALGK